MQCSLSPAANPPTRDIRRITADPIKVRLRALEHYTINRTRIHAGLKPAQKIREFEAETKTPATIFEEITKDLKVKAQTKITFLQALNKKTKQLIAITQPFEELGVRSWKNFWSKLKDAIWHLKFHLIDLKSEYASNFKKELINTIKKLQAEHKDQETDPYHKQEYALGNRKDIKSLFDKNLFTSNPYNRISQLSSFCMGMSRLWQCSQAYKAEAVTTPDDFIDKIIDCAATEAELHRSIENIAGNVIT